jgi:hypothetical protein
LQSKKRCYVFNSLKGKIDEGLRIMTPRSLAPREQGESKKRCATLTQEARAMSELKIPEDLQILAKQIVERIVTDTVRLQWVRTLADAFADKVDADDSPTEEDMLRDALNLALGDDIGCADEDDEDFRENTSVYWVEDKLSAYRAALEQDNAQLRADVERQEHVISVENAARVAAEAQVEALSKPICKEEFIRHLESPGIRGTWERLDAIIEDRANRIPAASAAQPQQDGNDHQQKATP